MKILFVCTGNTCRSCMAEAIFNTVCEHENIASSAGVAIVTNSKMSLNASAMVKGAFGIDLSERKAVQLTSDMLYDADLVLTMTSRIKFFFAA